MSSRLRRWEQLQARWARGERLSEDEERARLDYAGLDAMAHRELELFAELRERAKSDGDPVPPALIEGVLDAVQGRPRLRLITSAEQEPKASLDEQRPARKRGLVMTAALVAAAALAVALLVLPSAVPRPAATARPTSPALPLPAARATLVLAAGDALVDGRPAHVGRDPLQEGQVIATRDGNACLTIGSGIDVCLARSSSVQLQSLAARSIRLQVESGTALAALASRPPGSTFSLITHELSARAHGTTFAARREQGQSEVIVLDGAVDVVRGGRRPERVDAHSRVFVRSAVGALERSPVDRGEEERLIALRSWHDVWAADASSMLQLFAAPQGALRASVDDQASLPLPLQLVVRAGKHRLTWHEAAGSAKSSWIDVAAGETRRVEAPPANLEAAPAEEQLDKRSPAALLDAARREVGRGRPGAALALYERLRATFPSSAEAHTVLVTMGKLELGLARHERALRHFDSYLGNGGALTPEALAGKIRALRALGRRAEERNAIRQYLARHPLGLEAPLFEKRLQELGPT